jgi:predicted Zn-dependent peptidase
MSNGFASYVLPNGLRVVSVANPALYSFVFSTYVRVGPRNESPEEIGLTHLLEHMLIQGSANYPRSNDIMRGVEDVGGILDAATYPEYVNVAFGVHRKHWERVVDIGADILLQPLLDPDEIEHEKLIIAQELAQHRDSDGRNISLSELAHSLFFKGTLSELGTRGNRELLATFTADTVRSHYERYFRPESTVMCLAGGFDPEAVLPEIERRFGGNVASPPLPGAPPAPASRPDGRALSFCRRTETHPVVELLVGYQAVGMADDRVDGARAAARLLGGGLSSRLFTRVREEMGLVYDIEAHMQVYSDCGVINCFLSADADNVVPAAEAALEVIRETREGGFDADELARHKEGVRCGVEMLNDRPDHLADWYGRQELLLGSGEVVSPAEYVARQEGLCAEDLRGALQDFVRPERAHLVCVGPFQDAAPDELAALFPARKVIPA